MVRVIGLRSTLASAHPICLPLGTLQTACGAGGYAHPNLGLSEAIRAVLAESSTPLAAWEVRGRLADRGLSIPLRGVRSVLYQLTNAKIVRYFAGTPARFTLAEGPTA